MDDLREELQRVLHVGDLLAAYAHNLVRTGSGQRSTTRNLVAAWEEAAAAARLRVKTVNDVAAQERESTLQRRADTR